MWVVKVGGSLERSSRIRELLGLLVNYGRSKVVVVPGGGRFADRVRARQSELNLDEATAHVMALQAMEQYARVLRGLNSSLYPIAHTDEMAIATKHSAVPVWLPGKLLGERADIPASWRVTSDSLALWFANQIDAEALVLVKAAVSGTSDVDKLVASGYLDEYFPEMVKRTGMKRIACVCIDNLEVLARIIIAGSLPAEILLHV